MCGRLKGRIICMISFSPLTLNTLDVINYLLHHVYFSTRLCRANILLYTGHKDTTATSRKVAYISFFIV